MARTYFHTTAAAEAILGGGFRDGRGSYGFAHIRLQGVFLSDTPAGISDGASGEQVLAVELPDDVHLEPFAISDGGREPWEWVVPAVMLNERSTVRLLSQAEVDEALYG